MFSICALIEFAMLLWFPLYWIVGSIVEWRETWGTNCKINRKIEKLENMIVFTLSFSCRVASIKLTCKSWKWIFASQFSRRFCLYMSIRCIYAWILKDEYFHSPAFTCCGLVDMQNFYFRLTTPSSISAVTGAKFFIKFHNFNGLRRFLLIL